MEHLESISGYEYVNDGCTPAHSYILPAVIEELAEYFKRRPDHERRVFDLGCGNGSVANRLSDVGYKVAGVDPSHQGIAQANEAFPKLRLERGSAYDDLQQIYGQYSAVISLEVVEHVYAPRDYAATLYALVEPGGIAVVSTPYHGYLKNLALAAAGAMDRHYTALWDHGHIKFWSMATLTTLLQEAGFREIHYRRVGRIPALAKSMIAIASKPR